MKGVNEDEKQYGTEIRDCLSFDSNILYRLCIDTPKQTGLGNDFNSFLYSICHLLLYS